MILATTETLHGYELTEMMGIVKGSAVMSKNIGHDILAGLQTIVGGEIHSYQIMLEESRTLAEKRMIEQAQSMGADAIIGVRYSSSSVMQGAAEMMVYGTAVRIKVRT